MGSGLCQWQVTASENYLGLCPGLKLSVTRSGRADDRTAKMESSIQKMTSESPPVVDS